MKENVSHLPDAKRLELIAETVRYCQHVAKLGMPKTAYAKTMRETIYSVWTSRLGPKTKSARYRSREAVGLRFGRGKIRYDHAIPFRYELQALMNLSAVTPDTMRPILEKYDVHTIITADEDTKLAEKKLKSEMPEGWDGTDRLARYKAVGIEVLENEDALR